MFQLSRPDLQYLQLLYVLKTELVIFIIKKMLRYLLFAGFLFSLKLSAQPDASKTSIQFIRITSKDSTLPLSESIKKQLESALRASQKQSAGMRLRLQLKNKSARNDISRWLAYRNKTTLLQVNLGSLVSKYIGETEKNLEQVFSKASKSNTTLFFDEADALFGKRSSNAEENADQENAISYLLNQIALYKGTVIMHCTGEDCETRLLKLQFTRIAE